MEKFIGHGLFRRISDHKKRSPRRTILCALLVGAAVVASAWIRTEPAHAGKPKPPPPPPPPVLYEIQFWQTPNPGATIDKMNNNGQVVGHFTATDGTEHAFLYDPAKNAAMAVDLNSQVTPPQGWTITSAVDINDQGVIVGYLQTPDGLHRSGYVLDTTVAPLALQPLPDQGSTFAMGWRINESGDVLGVYGEPSGKYGAYVYNPALNNGAPVDLNVTMISPLADMNNPVPGAHDTQVTVQVDDGTNIGKPLRWTRGQGFDSYATTTTRAIAINDSGTICGWTTPVKSGRPYPFRDSYPTDAMDILTIAALQGGSAVAINSSGDLLITVNNTSTGYVYQDTYGALSIVSLLDPADPDVELFLSYTQFYAYDMNDRVSSAPFGQIVGLIVLADGTAHPYVLTPK